MLALLSVALGASAQMLLKAGVGAATGRGAGAVLATAARSPEALGGIVLFGLSSAVWLVVLSRLRLSAVYPFGALSYLFVVGAGVFMGEQVSAWRWAGVLLVALGVVLVGGGDLARDDDSAAAGSAGLSGPAGPREESRDGA